MIPHHLSVLDYFYKLNIIYDSVYFNHFTSLFAMGVLAQNKIDYRNELIIIMEKITTEKIKEGTFDHNRQVVKVSTTYFNPASGGLNSIKFQSVIGTFVYVNWNVCEGLYLTKSILGKIRSAYNTLKNQLSLHSKTNNVAYNDRSYMEYIDSKIPYIIKYPSKISDLPKL